MTDKRFIIGIDLGTTNCALAFYDNKLPEKGVQSFAIRQWEETGEVSPLTLPSFLYFPTKAEKNLSKWELGENPHVVGRLARSKLKDNPDRVVHSAKSWLCHGGVSRQERILPWQSETIIGDKRVSPVDASAAYLRHLRQIWDESFVSVYGDEASFSSQQIWITVPASFDEVAQSLSLDACRLAGFGDDIHLIEEPMAAFFDCFTSSESPSINWLNALISEASQSCLNVLVVDIGGGTSDFSLLKITSEENSPVIERSKVSKHLLLGGDNIDLMLAAKIESKRPSSEDALRSSSWLKLLDQARLLKERLLSQEKVPEVYRISLDTSSKQLFDSVEVIEIETQPLLEELVEAFFPRCLFSDRPSEQLGLTEIGLPYAQDTAITRYLAEFLNGENIDAVVYAGGSLLPEKLRGRLTNTLESWYSKPIKEIATSNLDLAVSRGAVLRACLLASNANLIRNVYPRSLFLKVVVDSQVKLLCLASRGQKLSEAVSICDLGLKAKLNRRVRFELYSDNSDFGSKLGEVYSYREHLHKLAPLEAFLKAAKSNAKEVAVDLRVNIASTGLLQLELIAKQPEIGLWKLEFHTDLDNSSIIHGSDSDQADPAKSFSFDYSCGLESILAPYFGKSKQTQVPKMRTLTYEFEQLFKLSKSQWSLHQLRASVDSLLLVGSKRARSIDHELSWLHHVGFGLRPGFGSDFDYDRCQQLWKIWLHGPSDKEQVKLIDQWWLMWRRVSGGLSGEQQNQIYDKLRPALLKSDKALTREALLCLASLERLEMNRKLQLVRILIDQLESGDRNFIDAKLWGLARLLSRQLLYGSADKLISASWVEQSLARLMNLSLPAKYNRALAFVFSQGARLINEREFDLSMSFRKKVIQTLVKLGAEANQLLVVESYQEADLETMGRLFGEELPIGLSLVLSHVDS